MTKTNKTPEFGGHYSLSQACCERTLLPYHINIHCLTRWFSATLGTYDAVTSFQGYAYDPTYHMQDVISPRLLASTLASCFCAIGARKRSFLPALHCKQEHTSLKDIQIVKRPKKFMMFS